MKKLISIFLILSTIMCCTACSERQNVFDTSQIEQTDNNNAYSSRKHVAYYKAFSEYIEYFSDLKYIVVDYNNISLTQRKYLTDLFMTYCDNENITFFQDTKAALSNRKIIENGTYKDGIVVTYNELEYSDNLIVLEIELWHSENNNIKEKVVLEKDEDDWYVKK